MRYPFSSWNDFAHAKIKEPFNVKEELSKKRKAGKTVATINGSFDLFHAGHLYILFEASKVADILVVALNTDASVKRYKSSSRPIIPLKERMETIAALAFVDYVTFFDEDDPREIISLLRPDVHVNGAEYGENCIEAKTVLQCGGKLHLVDRIPGLATSSIISTIKALCD
jgi:D-glycero-beta-D-manno-heptose 1-phosphate adenylyltransferase